MFFVIPINLDHAREELEMAFLQFDEQDRVTRFAIRSVPVASKLPEAMQRWVQSDEPKEQLKR